MEFFLFIFEGEKGEGRKKGRTWQFETVEGYHQ